MYKKITLGASLVLVFASLVGLVQTQPASATVVKKEKITICHRHNSVTNPYNVESVNVNAADGISGNNNGNDHFGEHQGPLATSQAVAQSLKDSKTKWGDIIPPIPGVHDGLNWTAAGQAIYNNGCNYAPSDVVFTAPTCENLGTYTIPDTEGFEYSINEVVVAAGEYTAPNGSTVTVVATALEGYTIDGGTSEWTYTFTAPSEADCVLGDTDTPVVPDLPVTSGDSTIANVTLISSIVGLITILSLVARSVLARQI